MRLHFFSGFLWFLNTSRSRSDLCLGFAELFCLLLNATFMTGPFWPPHFLSVQGGATYEQCQFRPYLDTVCFSFRDDKCSVWLCLSTSSWCLPGWNIQCCDQHRFLVFSFNNSQNHSVLCPSRLVRAGMQQMIGLVFQHHLSHSIKRGVREEGMLCHSLPYLPACWLFIASSTIEGSFSPVLLTLLDSSIVRLLNAVRTMLFFLCFVDSLLF